jgi:hypothetical protein
MPQTGHTTPFGKLRHQLQPGIGVPHYLASRDEIAISDCHINNEMPQFGMPMPRANLRSGDRLLFESDEKGVRVRPVRTESPFAKFKGIGNPGIGSGRKGIIGWVRELRGR